LGARLVLKKASCASLNGRKTMKGFSGLWLSESRHSPSEFKIGASFCTGLGSKPNSCRPCAKVNTASGAIQIALRMDASCAPPAYIDKRRAAAVKECSQLCGTT
jgi:hypothetical protein